MSLQSALSSNSLLLTGIVYHDILITNTGDCRTVTVLWIELNYTQCSSNSWEYIYNNYLAAHVQCMDRNKHVCHYNQHNCGIHFYLLISCSTTSWPPPKSTTVTVARTSSSIVSLRSYLRNWPSNSTAAKPKVEMHERIIQYQCSVQWNECHGRILC